MTEHTPATDAEIVGERYLAERGHPLQPEQALALLARLDAATAQAAKWERMCHDAQAAKVDERARAETAERKLEVAREALLGVSEYWDGSRTEGAMADALNHIQYVVDTTLAAIDGEGA